MGFRPCPAPPWPRCPRVCASAPPSRDGTFNNVKIVRPVRRGLVPARWFIVWQGRAWRKKPWLWKSAQGREARQHRMKKSGHDPVRSQPSWSSGLCRPPSPDQPSNHTPVSNFILHKVSMVPACSTTPAWEVRIQLQDFWRSGPHVFLGTDCSSQAELDAQVALHIKALQALRFPGP